MKLLITASLFLCTSFSTFHNTGNPSPLADYSAEWNAPRFLKCNTAANIAYLSEKEKELIYIFNLLRMDPVLFSTTVVRHYPERSGQNYLAGIDEYKSLLTDLAGTKPLPLLYADKGLTESAKCHAITSGQKAYEGHERQTEACNKKLDYQGECCDYGESNPLDVLMRLLIDANVPGLGHRFLCLSEYKFIGVSIQPHREYGSNTVIDFKF